MFIGEYNHNIDNKGRLAVPVKFRSLLKNGGVVTKGLDGCLFLYTKTQWKEIAKKLSDLPVSQSKARAFARHFLAGAMDLEFDNQGRVTLPEYLRIFAGLKKDAIIAGLYDHLEIWDKDSWESYKKKSEKNSDAIAEDLGDLGI
jgi:MraZ protein